jgi:hypothetical protein
MPKESVPSEGLLVGDSKFNELVGVVKGIASLGHYTGFSSIQSSLPVLGGGGIPTLDRFPLHTSQISTDYQARRGARNYLH